MRQRVTNSDKDNHDQDEPTSDTPFIFKMPSDGRNIPACQDLIAMKPAKHGYCYKEDTTLWATLCCCLVEKWKKRYFVLIGNYLIRYKNEHGEKPKGVPIPLDCANVVLRECGLFEVSTIRKTYQIKVDSHVEAVEWVNQIRTRKAAAIRENMGHVPVSKDISNVNRAAFQLFDERVRMDRKEAKLQDHSVSNPMVISTSGLSTVAI